MSSFYNILAESLEKKYKLNEAWGSAPAWMKPALMSNTNAYASNGGDDIHGLKHKQKLYRNNKNYRQIVDAIAKMNNHSTPNADDYDNAMGEYVVTYPDSSEAKKFIGLEHDDYDYANPRGLNASTTDKSLYKGLQDRGIDITDPDIKFSEEEPPKSRKSNKADEKTIYACWAFSNYNGQLGKDVYYLYIKGINDYEKPIYLTNLTDDTLPQKPFHYWPLKSLNENCTHFAYMDVSQSIPIDFKAQADARNQYRKDKEEAQRYGQERISDLDVIENEGPYSTLLIDPYANGGFRSPTLTRDKSGYKQIPTSSKYAEQLRKLGAAKWADKLEECERTLRKMQKDLVVAVQSISFDSSNPNLRAATNAFDNALQQYNNMRGAVRDTVKYFIDTVEDVDTFAQALKDKSSFNAYYTRFSGYVDAFYSYISKTEVLDF